jgi:hypothetical protein
VPRLKDGASWSDWTALPHDEDMRNIDGNEQFAGPVRVPRPSRYAQYRTWLTGGDTNALDRMALTFMDVTDVNAGPVAQLMNDITGAFADMWHSYADAAPAGRAEDPHAAGLGCGRDPHEVGAKYQRVQKAIIHHTVTDDGGTNVAATIRSIYYFHAVTRAGGATLATTTSSTNSATSGPVAPAGTTSSPVMRTDGTTARWAWPRSATTAPS